MLGTARKKPIEIDAIHYNDFSYNIGLLYNWLQNQSKEPISRDENTKTIYIHKKRGNVALPLGNWLIHEINTDARFWSIDPEIFTKTYEPVKPQDCDSIRFKKKIYEISFCQLTDLSDKSILEAYHFLRIKKSNESLDVLTFKDDFTKIRQQGYLTIETLEGSEKVYPNEFIVKGIDNEYYPVSAENFNKVYDIIKKGINT